MSHILQIQNTPVVDTSLTKIEELTINPNNPNALHPNDVISFSMFQTDSLILLEKSYFTVSGKITAKDGEGKIVAPTKTKLANGAALHFFVGGELRINNMPVERVVEPAFTAIPRICTTYNELNVRQLQSMGWGNETILNADGTFNNIIIPFKVLFNIAEDFRSVLVNAKLDISLTRARSDDNAVFCSGAEDYKLTITHMAYKLPFVSVDDAQRLRLLKIIEKDTPLFIAFRTWDLYSYPDLPSTTKLTWTIKTSSQLEKPRAGLVFFSTGRRGKPTKTASEYDHCDVTSVTLKLNNEKWPNENTNQDFSTNNYSIFYNMLCNFSASYNSLPEPAPLITFPEYKSSFPFFVIDCSRQRETLKYGPVDVRVEIEASKPFPKDTYAYCLIVHDTVFEYRPLTSSIRKYEG